MNDLKKEFKGSYDEGRSDFATQIENVRQGSDISSDYYTKIAKNGCFPTILAFFAFFFLLRQVFKLNFLLSLIGSYLLAMGLLILWSLLLVRMIKLKARNPK
ncbi:MAG: hypothetical protein ABIK26_05420 [Candidatus Omnitrophota bacterium]